MWLDGELHRRLKQSSGCKDKVEMTNTRTILRLTAMALGVVSLAACATKPKYPAAVPPAPAPQPAPAPEAPPAPVAQAPVGPVPGSEQDFVVNVGDRAYFDFDQYTVRDDARPMLDRQAEWLQRYPQVQVRIEGNADERGTREYNFALGARRADSIRAYLVSHGVSPSRITTISYGKERPIDPGHDEAAWAKDRNAHTALTSGTAG
jgi:peptidoglycan-associated lipoprotein